MNKMTNYVEIKEHKEKARIAPIEVFPDPKVAIVLTYQHTGTPNKPLVSVGDTVAMGQKIADSKEKISSPVHSPISGKVIKIGDIYNSCYAECSEAIWIENDNKNTKDKTLTPANPRRRHHRLRRRRIPNQHKTFSATGQTHKDPHRKRCRRRTIRYRRRKIND
jgi:Na+-translocating ferredoxin:NAD+ oxidoreductase RnfC subunit